MPNKMWFGWILLAVGLSLAAFVLLLAAEGRSQDLDMPIMPKPLPLNQLMEKIQDVTVMIRDYETDSRGRAGVFINNYTILTAGHAVNKYDRMGKVIGRVDKVWIYLGGSIVIDGKRRENKTIGRVLNVSNTWGWDLALISLAPYRVLGKTHGFAPLRLDPQVGEEAWMVGVPTGSKILQDTVTYGRIAKILTTSLIVTNKAMFGNSGGGVFDSRGNLVGLTVAGFGYFGVGDFLTMIVPAIEIKHFLDGITERKIEYKTFNEQKNRDYAG